MIDADVHVIEPPELFPDVGYVPDEPTIPKAKYWEHLDRVSAKQCILLPTKTLYIESMTQSEGARYNNWVREEFPEEQFIKAAPINLKWNKFKLKEYLSGDELPQVVVATPTIHWNPGTLSVLSELSMPLILHPVCPRDDSPQITHALHSPIEGMVMFANLQSHGMDIFPNLRILFLETGSWWVVPLSLRLQKHNIQVNLDNLYFGADLMYGEKNFVFGSDFPHFDMQDLRLVVTGHRIQSDKNLREFLWPNQP